jgi:hypothetical protein
MVAREGGQKAIASFIEPLEDDLDLMDLKICVLEFLKGFDRGIESGFDSASPGVLETELASGYTDENVLFVVCDGDVDIARRGNGVDEAVAVFSFNFRKVQR